MQGEVPKTMWNVAEYKAIINYYLAASATPKVPTIAPVHGLTH